MGEIGAAKGAIEETNGARPGLEKRGQIGEERNEAGEKPSEQECE
jgi:hypothetical protein